MIHYLPPVELVVDGKNNLTNISSVDDICPLDISTVFYADLVSFEDIVSATPVHKRISVIPKSSYMDIARKQANNDSIGILVLHLQSGTILVVDDHREVLIKQI